MTIGREPLEKPATSTGPGAAHTVMEIPVTAGVIAAIALPIATVVGALAALVGDWTIEVDRKEPE